jgi:4'-phosphopantetheinyl transferase
LHDSLSTVPAACWGGGPPAAGALWTIAFGPAGLADAAGAECWLDGEERQRAERFVHAADRTAFVLAHALLHALLERACGLPRERHRFVRNAHGRPQWDGVPTAPHFSLSHARGLVAVAFGPAGCRIGVDAESGTGRPADLWRLARRTCAPVEADWVEAAPSDTERQDRFLRLWTLKEALVKACGHGLSLGPETFAVAVDPPRLHAAPPALRARHRWQLEHRRPVDGGWVALALDGPPAPDGALHHVHLDQVSAAALLAPAEGGAPR